MLIRTTLLLATFSATASAARAQVPQPLDTLRTTVSSRLTGTDLQPRSVDRIGRDEIDRSPGATIAWLLATRLGVDLSPRSPAQADLSIRGSSYEQVVILVDGVRVSDAQSGHFNLDLAVPLDAVESIEIIRGGGSALHGTGAIGGVVNIITRAAPAATLSLRGGSFGTAAGSVAAGHRTAATAVRLTAMHEQSTGHRPGTDYRIGQLRAGATVARGATTLAVDAGVGDRQFGASDFYAPFPSWEQTGTAEAGVRLGRQLTSRWSASASANGRRHTDHFVLRRDAPDAYRNRHLGTQQSVELVARRLASPTGHQLAIGTEWWHGALQSQRLGQRNESRLSLFAESRAALGLRASLTTGVRGDRRSSGESFVSPSIGAAWRVADAVTIRAAADAGFRAPTWTERYYADPANIGNPDLRAERFAAIEAGVRSTHGWGHAEATLWRRQARDLIDWTRPAAAQVGTPWRTTNVTSATFTGAEAQVMVPMLAGARWQAALSTLDFTAAAAEGFVGKYALRPLQHQATLSVERPMRRHLVRIQGLAGQRVGERSWFTANARATWPLPGARLIVDAINIGDARQLDASGQPVAGRAMFVAIEWRR
jgi:outer membrane cobalamin receptor